MSTFAQDFGPFTPKAIRKEVEAFRLQITRRVLEEFAEDFGFNNHPRWWHLEWAVIEWINRGNNKLRGAVVRHCLGGIKGAAALASELGENINGRPWMEGPITGLAQATVERVKAHLHPQVA